MEWKAFQWRKSRADISAATSHQWSLMSNTDQRWSQLTTGKSISLAKTLITFDWPLELTIQPASLKSSWKKQSVNMTCYKNKLSYWSTKARLNPTHVINFRTHLKLRPSNLWLCLFVLNTSISCLPPHQCWDLFFLLLKAEYIIWRDSDLLT